MGESGSTGKRLNYIEWDEYFMATAFMEKHFTPTLQNVALVLNPRKIISKMQGGNGRPDYREHAVYKVLQGIPAECDTMYTINYPCYQCAEEIVNKNLKKVFYFKGDEELRTKELFEEEDVQCSKLEKSLEIEINFEKFYNEKPPRPEKRKINGTANPTQLTINNNAQSSYNIYMHK